jgi:hypothetical protein
VRDGIDVIGTSRKHFIPAKRIKERVVNNGLQQRLTVRSSVLHRHGLIGMVPAVASQQNLHSWLVVLLLGLREILYWGLL